MPTEFRDIEDEAKRKAGNCKITEAKKALKAV